jgi:hypothetical protein
LPGGLLSNICLPLVSDAASRISYRKTAKESAVGVEVSGLLGLIILVIDVWAIINVLGSGATPGSKLLWIVAILVLPVLGALIWLFAGPRSRAA